jgi:hypothetical protein
MNKISRRRCAVCGERESPPCPAGGATKTANPGDWPWEQSAEVKQPVRVMRAAVWNRSRNRQDLADNE